MTRIAISLAALLVIGIGGCQDKAERTYAIDWDLTEGATTDAVKWQGVKNDGEVGFWSLEGNISFRVTLPSGAVWKGRGRLVHLSREGRLIKSIRVHYREETLRDAVARASQILRERKCDAGRLDQWARAAKAVESESDVTMEKFSRVYKTPTHYFELGIAHTFGDSRPWYTYEVMEMEE